jgi:hypothetical protein
MPPRPDARSRAARQAIRSPFTPDTPPAIRVNCASVLTLWATVVVERLGYPAETTMTLGRFVAGSSASAKARRLGISDEKQDAEEHRAPDAEMKPQRQTVHLLGRDIPVVLANDGSLRAEDDGKPASDKSVQSYITRAFGDRLAEVRAAMEALAASLPPEELNRVGFPLYERFRPDVPEGAQGRGAKGELRLERIVGVGGDVPVGQKTEPSRLLGLVGFDLDRRVGLLPRWLRGEREQAVRPEDHKHHQ